LISSVAIISSPFFFEIVKLHALKGGAYGALAGHAKPIWAILPFCDECADTLFTDFRPYVNSKHRPGGKHAVISGGPTKISLGRFFHTFF
jgi:hypothetical protein